MNTSALGGIYNDQSILIAEICHIAKKYDINVIVKDNPKQSFLIVQKTF
tara:strand:+ start:1304 stop:1450 length:147 start_codon:yes stop_codon:yes gene_type:complete